MLQIVIQIFAANLGILHLQYAYYTWDLQLSQQEILTGLKRLLQHTPAVLPIQEQSQSIQLALNLYHSSLAHQISWILKIKVHFSLQVVHWTVVQ